MVANGPSSSDEGGFLSRWSRLKRQQEPEVAKPAPAEAEAMAPTVEMPPAGQEGAVAAPADPRAEAEEKERQEVLARLPSLESIDATTDVTGFMHRLVPDALRNAALRAAWTADPAIRDFLNDAREYALDYNTPGAAPGYGPLTESDDIQSMISQIFGRPVDKNLAFLPDKPVEEGTESCDRESQEGASGVDEEPIPQPPEVVELASVRRSEPGAAMPEMSEKSVFSDSAAGEPASPGQAQPARPLVPGEGASSALRRRGGRATPL